jgi:hypothetical protein
MSLVCLLCLRVLFKVAFKLLDAEERALRLAPLTREPRR